MLTDRQKRILDLIIKEYSRKGEPISSKDLCEKFFADLSPATIRHDLFELTKSGYLIQPHTSAGRIPSNKSYKWFVKEILENENKIVSQSEQWQKKVGPLADWHENFVFQSARMIADFCEGLGVGYSAESGAVYKTGLKNLFSHLAGISLMEVNQILEDIEFIDERIESVWDKLVETERVVFIGKESPITRSDNLSIIARSLPIKEKSLMLLIGPKNMIYERNLAILEAVANMLE